MTPPSPRSAAPGGILARLTLSFLLLCWSAGAVASALSYLVSRSFLESSLTEQLQLGGYEKEYEVRRWVNNRKKDFLLLSGHPALALLASRPSPGEGDRKAVRDALDDFLAHKPEFRDLMLLSPDDGRVVVASDRGREGDYRTRDTFFLQGRKGFFTQQAHISPLTGKPAITFSLPLRRRDGSPAAILAGDLRLERLHQAVLQLARLGETAEAYFVERNGVVVASSRTGREEFLEVWSSEGTRKALAGESGAGSYRNREGKVVLGAYRWIPDLSLALLVEVDRAAAMGPARRLGLQILFAATAVALLAALAGRLVAVRFARPVLSMAAAARRLSSGDYSVRADRGGTRELDDLADAFNGMVGGLLAANAALARTVGEVKESERRYRLLAENAGDGIWTMDGRGILTYASPSVDRLLGGRPEGFSGVPLARIIAEAGGEPPPVLRHILDGNVAEAGPPPWRAELSLRRRDGSPVETETVVSPMTADAGGGFLGVTRDVTERRRAERERWKLEERLSQSRRLEALGSLAGGIAHDFNNLLSGMSGFLSLARMKLEKGEEATRELERIGTASDRAADLVRQILAFSRQAPMELRSFAAATAVREALRLLRGTLPPTVEVRQEIRSEARVQADPTLLHQVVTNLCTNGVRAMEPCGGVLTVRLDEVTECGEDGGDDLPFLRISVIDTGRGIPAEHLDRIFEPFFTTGGDRGGTGLGLSVVHGIVTSLGGRIRVESAPGKGARFDVLLPVREGDGEEELPPPAGGAAEGAGETVLVAEDEPLVREFLDQALSRLGYRVEAVEDGEEALRRVEESPGKYDLLLTDLAMPRLRGDALAVRVRAAAPRLPVVLCTGFQEGLTTEEAERLGISALLVKPVPLPRLAETLREALGGAARKG